jgi:hypothetical protein
VLVIATSWRIGSSRKRGARARALVAVLHDDRIMWLLLQRIIAGIGRLLRRPWESRRVAARQAPVGAR